jgi:integrase
LASVRFRRGRYFGRFRDEYGRRVELRLSAKASRLAQEEADDLESRARSIRRGLQVPFPPITVQAVWERYAAVARGLASWATVEGRFRNHLLPVFGARFLHELKPEDVERLLTMKELDEGMAPATCERLRMHLAALYTFAKETARCFGGDNPARQAKKPDIPQRPTRFLEAEYVVAVVEKVPHGWRNFFALAVYTGLRTGELRGLRLDSVDCKRRLLFIWRSGKRNLAKNKRLRVVPVPREAMPYLEAQLAQARSEWLFPSRKGGQLSRHVKLPGLLRTALKALGLVQGWQHSCVTRGGNTSCGFTERRADNVRTPCPGCGRRLWAKAIPLPLTFHSLRATNATHVYDVTGDIRHVQQTLGHAALETTERYVGPLPKRLLAQADRLTFQPQPQPRPTHSDGESQASEYFEDTPPVKRR